MVEGMRFVERMEGKKGETVESIEHTRMEGCEGVGVKIKTGR